MKKKWKILTGLLVICLLMAVGVAAFFVLRAKNSFPGGFSGKETKTVEVQAGIGEEVEYVQLVAVRGNEITYVLTGSGGNREEATILIPVGTDVITKLGTVTTFSRLRAGDNVALVKDKGTGEITAVYIVD